MKGLRWFDTMMNYIDLTLDESLNTAMNSGITYQKSTKYKLIVHFNNGTILDTWNANRYYGWLQNGTLIKGEHTYEWFSGRPKRKTMRKLAQMLSESFNN